MRFRVGQIFALLPMAVLIGAASLPVVALFARASAYTSVEWKPFAGTVLFAGTSAAVATIVGGTAGMLVGLREFRGRRLLIALAVVLLSAPPAFWWIGVSRLPFVSSVITGRAGAAFVCAIALSPITLVLVLASLNEMPANIYDAARLTLPPVARLRAIALPLIASACAAGFLLTFVLASGESELPFLFGFRTAMTDIVTTFSQRFDVEATVPIATAIVLVVLVAGALAGHRLVAATLNSGRGARGVIRRSASPLVGIFASAAAVLVVSSMAGYLSALGGAPRGSTRSLWEIGGLWASIFEPAAGAWFTVLVVLLAVYPVRDRRALRIFLWAGLLLFCIPSAIYAIGWIRAGQVVGISIPPLVAHIGRFVGVPAFAFALAYSRLPRSFIAAALLVPIAAGRRAHQFILPLVWPSLAVAAMLVAALIYADRDVASLLLPPGASRLMLDLYLRSANAPSWVIGASALMVLAGGGAVLLLAAALPRALWGWRA